MEFKGGGRRKVVLKLMIKWEWAKRIGR